MLEAQLHEHLYYSSTWDDVTPGQHLQMDTDATVVKEEFLQEEKKPFLSSLVLQYWNNIPFYSNSYSSEETC